MPWRLAAYYKMVVEPQGDPDGMLPVLNALKTFFEGQRHGELRGTGAGRVC